MNFDKLKKTLDILVDEYHTPGVDCIVCENHKEIFRYFAGMRDIENKVSMNGEEQYIIYSMTKMLTCTCALQLVEQGKLGLDDELSKYLPEFEKMKVSRETLDTQRADKISRGESAGDYEETKDDGYAQNPITIRHLFTMSAGFDYNLNSDPIKEALEKGKKTTRELVGAMSETVLGFEPGTRFRYSLCHDVLGAVVEVVSGMSLGEYMRENLLKPLGMKNTYFGVPKDEERLSSFAKRYMIEADGSVSLQKLECMFNLSDEYESGGAGLVSCTEDYALFLDALACGGVGKNGNRILSESTVKLMGTNHLEGQALEDFQNMRPGYGYGLGVRYHLFPEISGSDSPIGEFGWDGAAGAFSMIDLEKKISLTYFQEAFGWKKSIQNLLRNALYKCLEGK